MNNKEEDEANLTIGVVDEQGVTQFDELFVEDECVCELDLLWWRKQGKSHFEPDSSAALVPRLRLFPGCGAVVKGLVVPRRMEVLME